ncbi:MAG TPA: hypothetical protein VKF61_00035 [Candidatus Polarisedimenticolia bacterium]|nr:hypothetical protein [Candidatus Polarisedimenticolia bacterium]
MIRSRSSFLRSRAPAACALVLLCFGCAGEAEQKQASAGPAAKRFPAPLFDGLTLEMTRDEVARGHAIRPALTSAGRMRMVWVYDRPRQYAVELTFKDGRADARLERFDVHFGTNEDGAQGVIDSLARRLGEPDVKRRKATTNAYGDRLHDQYDTVYSDDNQYVFVVERVPVDGRSGRTTHFITVKKKELAAKGPPTGYIPPPPPLDKDGKPVEEPVF